MIGFTLLDLDIIQISKMDFESISVKSSWHLMVALPAKNKDIIKILSLRKAVVSWSNMQL